MARAAQNSIIRHLTIPNHQYKFQNLDSSVHKARKATMAIISLFNNKLTNEMCLLGFYCASTVDTGQDDWTPIATYTLQLN